MNAITILYLSAHSITASSLIESYMSSKVVSSTVYLHAYKSGNVYVDFLCFGSSSIKLQDKVELVNAIKAYYQANKNSNDPLMKEKLKAFAAMLCVEIDFVNNEVVFTTPYTPGMNPFTEKDGVYYFTKDGEKVTGWQVINEKLYYLDLEGALVLGWLEIESSKYYITVNDGAYKGICEIDDVLYQFAPNGELVKIIA